MRRILRVVRRFSLLAVRTRRLLATHTARARRRSPRINNWRRHDEDERSLDARSWMLDRYSSAITFTGWANWSLRAWPADYVALPVARPQTWLLDKGWLRGGKPIRTDEVPGPLR